MFGMQTGLVAWFLCIWQRLNGLSELRGQWEAAWKLLSTSGMDQPSPSQARMHAKDARVTLFEQDGNVCIAFAFGKPFSWVDGSHQPLDTRFGVQLAT